MKSAIELAVSLQQEYDNNPYAPEQAMYNMQKSGNILEDFAKFTDLQSGGKSDNKNDYYYYTTVNPAPSVPDTDGRYYHTVRDVTYRLYMSLFPNSTPSDFYNMTDADRDVCVKHMVSFALITCSDVVNYMLAYAVWGTGNCMYELSDYKAWYGALIQDDCNSTGDRIMLDRITDIRLYVLSGFTTTKDNPGQPAGVLNLWNLLKQYC